MATGLSSGTWAGYKSSFHGYKSSSGKPKEMVHCVGDSHGTQARAAKLGRGRKADADILLVCDKHCDLILKHESLPLPSVHCEAHKTLFLEDLSYSKV